MGTTTIGQKAPEGRRALSHEDLGRRPAWKVALANLFSFPVMCVFLMAAFIFRFCIVQVSEPDIWWHLRNARYALQFHSLPRFDYYSFGAAGSPWLNHEWLSEIPYYLAFQGLGLRGVFAVYFILIWLIFAGVYYRACRAGADCKDATLVTTLAIVFGGVSIGPRMLLFGWLFLVAELILLDRFQRSGKGVWLLPPLFAVWINFHGSWVFGMMVLGITVACGLVEGDWGLVSARRWSPMDLKKLLMAGVLSFAALFLNPFGYKLVLYPFDLFFRQTSNLKHIEEWHSVDFNTPHGKLALFMIVAVMAAAWFSKRRWQLSEVLLTVFAFWFALSHVRLFFFAGIVLPPILGQRLNLFSPYDRSIDKPWLNGAIMVALVASLLYFLPSNSAIQSRVNEQFPTAALEFMQQHHLNVPVFNTYGWGGYMEWVAPGVKPFIDGRADIFVYNGTFDEYGDVGRIVKPFEVLDKYKLDYVLDKPDAPLSYLLGHSPKWRTIYSDKVAVLFERVPESPGKESSQAGTN